MMAVGLHLVSLLLANQTFGESDWDLAGLLRVAVRLRVVQASRHH